MKKIWLFLLANLLGLFVITACDSASATVVPTPIPSATPQAALENKTLPTPISAGQTVVYNDLQLTMDQAEITDSYLTEYGSNREPTGDNKFLWTHIILMNISQKEQSLPDAEHFSALFATTEFKPAYGHRKGHVDYMALNEVIDQGEEVDAWLRFDIPTEAELTNLTFAFLPESTQVSFGFSSNEYFWADHPIYLWDCAP